LLQSGQMRQVVVPKWVSGFDSIIHPNTIIC
jgi:hypothetical protein